MYFKLLKIYLKDFSIDRLLQINGSKGKKIAIGIALFYAVVVLMGGLGFLFFNLAEFLASMNQIHILVSFLALYLLMIPIVMTLFRASGTIFFYKDYDIIAPLPISPKVVLSSKFTMMLIWMFIGNVLLMSPILFSYFYFNGFDFIGLLIYILLSVVFPLVPVIFMSFVSLAIGFIATKIKFGKMIQIILLFAIFLGIMFLQFNINESTVNPLTGQIDLIAGLSKYYIPLQWFQEAVYSHDLLSLTYILLTHLSLLIVFILSVDKLSYKVNQLGVQKYSNKKVNMSKVARSSVTHMLIKKEFNKFFSIPIYVLNAGFGIVILLVLSIASLFTKDINQILQTLELANLDSFVAISLIIGFVLALAYTPAISLSLEGKNFWVIKSLPIKAKTIMESKIYFNVLLILPVLILSILIFSFSLQFEFIDAILLILISTTLLILISYGDAVINLFFPKFDYKNEVEIVKQSLSAILGMLLGMAAVFSNGLIYYFLMDYISPMWLFLILSGLNILLTIPFYVMIRDKSEAVFQKL